MRVRMRLPIWIGCLLLLTPLLLHQTTLGIGDSSGAKRDFWRDLLRAALGGPQELLADRLARLPNQRKAALIYLELIARIRQLRTEQVGGSGAPPPAGASRDGVPKWNCLRASLAEIAFQSSAEEKNEDEWSRRPSRGPHEPVQRRGAGLFSTLGGRLKLAELPLKQVVALEHLQPAMRRASQLVMELANLVSRLAVQSASEFARNLAAERDFLRFLLESKLGGDGSARLVAAGATGSPPARAHSLGIVLFRGAEPEWAWLSAQPAGTGDTLRGVDLREHPRVGLPARQERRRRPFSSAAAAAAAATSRADEEEPNEEAEGQGGRSIGLNPNGYFNYPRGPQADWSEAGGGSEQRSSRVENGSAPSWEPAAALGQPFLLHWLERARKDDSLGQLGTRVSLGAPLGPRDGRWFSPYLDCGLSERWLFTYSVPLFARRSSSSSETPRSLAAADGQTSSAPDGAKFRGVAFVTLDFEQLKLIDQCGAQQPVEDGYEAAFFLGNTHECARLQGSQCVRLPEGGVRAGAYACQCPKGGVVTREQLDALSEFRDHLRNQNDTRQTMMISHHEVLAQWLLENPSTSFRKEGGKDPLWNRPLIGKQLMLLAAEARRKSASLLYYQPTGNSPLNGPKLSRQGSGQAEDAQETSYFALGAQLEADAALLALLSSPDGRGPLDWPAHLCTGCSTRRLYQAKSNTSSTQTHQVESSIASAQDVVAPDETTLYTPSELSGCSDLVPFDDREHRVAGSNNSNLLRPLVLLAQLLGSFGALTLSALLLRLRRSRIILASGWLMLETMLIGALLLYSSVLVRYFQATSITCLLEPWLRELGFSIFYGSILIKFYRIFTEFQTRKAHRVCLRDKDQMMYLLAIVLIVTGYMGAWTALMLDGFFYNAALQNTAASALENPIPSLMNAEHQQQPDFTWMNSIDSLNNPKQEPEEAAASTVSSSGLLGQLAEFAPSQVKLLQQSLSSFANLFSGLLEQQQHFDQETDVLTYSMRCRKLTWDYVTELSEMALLLFGIYLIYKLRNASSDSYKEKLVLSAAVFIELLVSGFAYVLKHAFWSELSVHQILLLYCLRCQLTVTPTLALVFGPKLWTIGKSRPALFGGSRAAATGSSMRHRCHISCELHDHHLDDAVRLHQAMLSNAALDFGSINLADMDPDEIQAELKRVYAQLEMLKTKAMRKDNPHISKRRGGRKTGHRKFSLQAFHAKHLGHHHHTPSKQSASSPTVGRSGASGSEQQHHSSELLGLDEQSEEEAAQQV